jgi:hypothetical protein
MGLAEKRKIKELQDTNIPERIKNFEEMTGAQIQYDVKWDSFADDFAALNAFDFLAMNTVEMAFRMICIDAMSKEAVQEGVNTISLENSKDKADNTISFANGVLSMRCAYGQGLDGIIREYDIKKVVEAGL